MFVAVFPKRKDAWKYNLLLKCGVFDINVNELEFCIAIVCLFVWCCIFDIDLAFGVSFIFNKSITVMKKMQMECEKKKRKMWVYFFFFFFKGECYPIMPISMSAKRASILVDAQSIGLKLYAITEPHDSNNRKLLNAASSWPRNKIP